MQKVYKIHAKKVDFQRLGQLYGVDQVIVRVAANRGLKTDEEFAEYFAGTMDMIGEPSGLKDAELAADIICNKAKEGKKIRIIGDYDADGICSTYILYTSLKMIGAVVDYVIPHRIYDGYGISTQIVEDAYSEGVDTILTCDNGIVAFEPMQLAKDYGMTVIITDHHEPIVEDGKTKLPNADAVVNPHQLECGYEFKDICGAVVALKVARLYVEKMLGKDEEWLSEARMFASIATVCDVMPLIGENRVLVQYGIEQMHHVKNVGLKALIYQSGIEAENIGSYHIGFVIGPCLNASGRLSTALKAIELLCESNIERANVLAMELKALNDERKQMTADWCDEAFAAAQEREDAGDRVLVIYLPECHESLAGIVAGRVKEHYFKPTIVLTDGENCAKGSGRSIPAYNMIEGIRECGEYLRKYGGHTMACGISLDKNKIVEFRQAINEQCKLAAEDMIPIKWIDVPMPLDYVTPELVGQLERLEPMGNGNEKPLFAQKGLTVARAGIVGKNQNVMQLTLSDASQRFYNCVKFNSSAEELPALGSQITITYYPKIESYMGKESLKFFVDDII